MISLLIARILFRYCSIIFWAVADTPEFPTTLLVYSSSLSEPDDVSVEFSIDESDSVAAVDEA